MTLYRQKKKTTHYYSVSMYPTLFNDFLLVHHCGKNCSQKSIKEYYASKKEALFRSLHIIDEKRHLGFSIKKKQ